MSRLNMVSTNRFYVFTSLLLITKSCIAMINCGNYGTLKINEDKNKTIVVHNATIYVEYDKAEFVYEQSNKYSKDFLSKYSEVHFSGLLDSDNINNQPHFISLRFNTIILGSTYVKKILTANITNFKCEFHMRNADMEKDEDGLIKLLKTKIIHEASFCIRSVLCKSLERDFIALLKVKKRETHLNYLGSSSVTNIDYVTSNEDVNTQIDNLLNGYGIMQSVMKHENVSTILYPLKFIDINHVHGIRLQSAINMLVDIAIAEIVRKIRKENKGVIKLPDINQRFPESSVWQFHGEFDAVNGFFSDLTTLKRIGDANISHDGYKFIASCGFGLSKANINYEKYKIKYGLSVSGKFSATIDGVSFASSVTVDYNQKPCKVDLKNIQITKLGKLQLTITGLGPFNHLTSNIIGWITKKWNEEICLKVEQEIREIVQSHVEQFDCEKYRP